VAPEAKQSNLCTAKLDIYSIGIVLRELLTGSPYEDSASSGDNSKSVPKATIPDELKPLIEACLNEDPTKRPSAAEIASRLKHLYQEPESKVQIQVKEIGAVNRLDPQPTANASSFINLFMYPSPAVGYHWFDQGIYAIPSITATDQETQPLSSLSLSSSVSSPSPPIPCRIATHPNAEWFIIFAHGNAADLGGYGYQAVYNLAQSTNSHVLVFEFSGYGVYEGVRNAFNVTQDCLSAYTFVSSVLKWPKHRIVLVGHSVGSGSILEVVRQLALASPSKTYHAPVVLVSAFSSVFDFIPKFAASTLGWWTSDPFKNADSLRFVSGPVLIVWGRKDALVTQLQFDSLVAAISNGAHNKTMVFPESDHSIAFGQIIRCMRMFFDSFEYSNYGRREKKPPVIDKKTLKPFRPTTVVAKNHSKRWFMDAFRKTLALSFAMTDHLLSPLAGSDDPIMSQLSDSNLRVVFLAGELKRCISAIVPWLKSMDAPPPYSKTIYRNALYYLNPIPNVFR